MKFRHAAALALVGWYLMAPPFDQVTLTFRKDISVSEWDNLRAVYQHWEGEFDSENQCEEFKAHMVAWLQKLNPKNRAEKYRQFKLGECIASDDPRLKEK